jgi:hypothetical protein
LDQRKCAQDADWWVRGFQNFGNHFVATAVFRNNSFPMLLVVTVSGAEGFDSARRQQEAAPAVAKLSLSYHDLCAGEDALLVIELGEPGEEVVKRDVGVCLDEEVPFLAVAEGKVCVADHGQELPFVEMPALVAAQVRSVAAEANVFVQESVLLEVLQLGAGFFGYQSQGIAD